jgi:hypothetical protein
MSDDEKITSTIIPALPGWELAIFAPAGIHDGESRPACVMYETIVAWDVEKYDTRPGDRWVNRYLIPITVACSDIDSIGNRWAVKRPDGRFEIPGEGVCDSEEKWIADCVERDEQLAK